MFYFTVNNPNDAISQEIIATNRKDVDFWQRLTPDDDEDLATAINRINAQTGRSRKLISSCLISIQYFKHLPGLKALWDELGHLDMARINTIVSVARTIPKELRELFDAYLVSYLTPSREAQVLPQASSIAAMLRKFVAQHCPAPQAPSVSDSDSLSYRRNKNGSIRVAATMEETEAIEMRTALESLSKRHNTSAGKALLNLVRGLETKVFFNIYGTQDNPEYLDGGAWLTPAQMEFWKERTTSYRNMDDAEFECTEAYAPTQSMRILINGRYLTCSVPGCHVEGKNCQIDHIIPYGAGGPTTPWNLHNLCIFHHIQKTEGRLQCYPLPNGDILYLIDGIPTVAVPQGPLSKSNRSWGTTFGNYMKRQLAA